MKSRLVDEEIWSGLNMERKQQRKEDGRKNMEKDTQL